MRTYKIQFQLKSSIRTPFHADTIFGHLCWAMRFLEGEEKLKAWLINYEESPTIISNAFEIGKFPRPILPPLSIGTLAKLKGFNPQKLDLKTATILKKMKKITAIDEKWITDHQNSFSNEAMSSYLFDLAEEALNNSTNKHIRTMQRVAITHNTYDRLNGSVLEGSLYEWEETFYLQADGAPQSFWFLIKTETLDKSEIENLLDFVSKSGYGADKSIGKGQFDIVSVDEHSIPVCSNANAFISLSNFIPAKPEDLNGYYKPITKYGKLGGEWATGRVPFKKPIVMVEAGAVIKDKDYSDSKFYGKLQTKVHRQPEIVQYGYAFPFPICLKEDI